MTCLKCSAPLQNFESFVAKHEFRGTSVDVILENVAVCSACNESFLTLAQLDRVAVAATTAYVAEKNILKAAEIRAARHRLKMNQQQFADYLGVGVASVKRWENGSVPEKAMSDLIRLKTQPSFAYEQVNVLLDQLYSQPSARAAWSFEKQQFTSEWAVPNADVATRPTVGQCVAA